MEVMNTTSLDEALKQPISRTAQKYTPSLQDSKEPRYPVMERTGDEEAYYKGTYAIKEKGRLFRLNEFTQTLPNHKLVMIMLAILTIFNIFVVLVSLFIDHRGKYWQNTVLYLIPKMAFALYCYAICVLCQTVYLGFRG